MRRLYIQTTIKITLLIAQMQNSPSLNTDIASKMLSALTFEPENVVETQKDMVPIEEQKRYLKRYVDSLSIADRKTIGNILVMNNKRSALNWCSEGTVINLDVLPNHVVEQMYTLIAYKMNN